MPGLFDSDTNLRERRARNRRLQRRRALRQRTTRRRRFLLATGSRRGGLKGDARTGRRVRYFDRRGGSLERRGGAVIAHTDARRADASDTDTNVRVRADARRTDVRARIARLHPGSTGAARGSSCAASATTRAAARFQRQSAPPRARSSSSPSGADAFSPRRARRDPRLY